MTDLFCGAGGSSLGAELAGATARLGLNHWRRAIETHSTNFEHADHDCADVSALTTAQIRRYPLSDILLASPECTNHTLAKGSRRRKPQPASLLDEGPAGDDAQERSRATMWDVWRFAEQAMLRGRPYKAIIVENVVDAFNWGPDDNGQVFAGWLRVGEGFGYRYEIVWLNSMLAHEGGWVPQSRDRMYVVWTLRSMRVPDLNIEPLAWCPRCEKAVHGRQGFKRSDRPRWGRYGPQYVFTCPECRGPAVPAAAPSITFLDESLPAPPIGERKLVRCQCCGRKRRVACPTRRRIRDGMQRLDNTPYELTFSRTGVPSPLTVPLVPLPVAAHPAAMVTPVSANTFERTPGNRADDVRRSPARTVHGTLDRALVLPPMGGVVPRSAATQPSPTQTTTTRAMVVEAQQHGGVRRAEAPVHTVRAAGSHHGVVTMANRENNRPRRVDESPSAAVLTGGSLCVVANYDPGWTRRSDALPSGSITTRDGHAVVVPYQSAAQHADAAPAATVTTVERHALLVPYATDNLPTLAETSPSSTVTTKAKQAVVWTDEDVDRCGFRMFALHEIAAAMALEHHVDGGEYVVLGNQEERMAQYGNAVTPPAMTLLVSRVLQVLDEAA